MIFETSQKMGGKEPYWCLCMQKTHKNKGLEIEDILWESDSTVLVTTFKRRRVDNEWHRVTQSELNKSYEHFRFFTWGKTETIRDFFFFWCHLLISTPSRPLHYILWATKGNSSRSSKCPCRLCNKGFLKGTFSFPGTVCGVFSLSHPYQYESKSWECC